MTRFPNCLSKKFGKLWNRNKKRNQLSDSEIVDRFLVHGNHINTRLRKVSYLAFLPGPDNETSVFRTGGLHIEQIWQLAMEQVIAKRQNCTLRGKGTLRVDQVRIMSLDVRSDESSHELHAVIMKWPIEKDKRKMLAIDLASIAVLTTYP